MISEVRLKAGPNHKSPGLKIQTTPITIFVGPNNSGKSRVLKEIEHFCCKGAIAQSSLLLEGMTLSPIGSDRIEQLIERVAVKPNQGELVEAGGVIVGSKRGRGFAKRSELTRWLANPEGSKVSFCEFFLKHTLLKLDGPNRIMLINEQPAEDLQMTQHGTLGALFIDDLKRIEVRRIVYEAFGAYFVVDPTHLGQFRAIITLA